MKFLLLFFTLSLYSKEILLTSRNTISFDQAFTAQYVANIQVQIQTMVDNNQDVNEFYIVINSPGGSVTAGQQLFSFIKGLGKKFHTITIFAASMGFHMVEALGDRYITEYGVLMSHRASLGGLGGQFPGDLNSRLKMYERSTELLDEGAAKRANMSLANYKKLIHDELWMVGKDALKLKFVDAVAFPKCDKTLSNVSKKEINTLFGKIIVTKADCPLIVGFLSMEYPTEEAKREYLYNIDTNRVRSEI